LQAATYVGTDTLPFAGLVRGISQGGRLYLGQPLRVLQCIQQAFLAYRFQKVVYRMRLECL
jgi:hypothetical protein